MAIEKPTLHIISSPALLPYYAMKGATVVVIDILRATSSICVAFAHGVEKILPVANPDECAIFREFDFLIAGERNAIKLDGFDLGNSPFEYMNGILQGRSIALTTTNGTKAIRGAREAGAHQILIGSFLNRNTIIQFLKKQTSPVFLLCAGWKDKLNLEDTLFAGSLAAELSDIYSIDCDTAVMAMDLYHQHQHDLLSIVSQSSHAKRFRSYGLQTDDVQFCLQHDLYPVLPMLSGEYLRLTTV